MASGERAQSEDSEGHTTARTWLKPEQVEEMRDACLSAEIPDYLQSRNETIIAVLYDVGLRRSELVGLDVSHFRPDRGALYLPSSVQKYAPGDATLTLGEYGADSTRQIKRYLRERWKDPEAMFPSRVSDRMSGRAVANVVKRAATIAGVEPYTPGGGQGDPSDVTPHTLRHSVAYRVIVREGGRLEDVQRRLRHKSRETTDRIYGHLRPR